MADYRRAAGPNPRPTALAVSVTVAASAGAADAREAELVAAGCLRADLVGAATTVARRLHELLCRGVADEIVLATFTAAVAERHEVFVSVAEQFRALAPVTDPLRASGGAGAPVAALAAEAGAG